jgi:RNA polymerase sigma-70 factor (ECF subfamily)
VSNANDKFADERASAASELTRAMAAGRPDAVAEFYRRYFDFLYSQARRACGRDEAFCLDVVQESVLRVIRLIRPVKSESQLAAWLKLVVRTTAYDLLKAERRRAARETMTVPLAASEPQADEAEQLDRLRAEIARLDPELVRIIEMRFEKNWTLRKIGALLGLSIGAVDGRLRRALAALKYQLEQSDRDG